MEELRPILNRIGETPLVKVKERVFAKLESVNPSGSIKDRMALYMLEVAERNNEIKPGYEIIEATSGNTGISFAMIAALKGYRFTAVMPETMTLERRQIMQAYGARFILTPTMKDAVERVERCTTQENIWLPKQFDNQANVDCHRETTGREVLQQLSEIGAFVAGVGTGGTLIGVSQALKEKAPDVQIVAVEPAESPVLSSGEAGVHKIQGIGSGFVPKIVDLNEVDEIVKVKSDDAIRMTRSLARERGLFVGISSGANVLASLEIAKRIPPDKNVVTVLPDSANRYLSMMLF